MRIVCVRNRRASACHFGKLPGVKGDDALVNLFGLDIPLPLEVSDHAEIHHLIKCLGRVDSPPAHGKT